MSVRVKLKKKKIKIPEKISANQIKKNYKKIKDKNKNDFKILFLLAVNLYMIKPDHDIFINGTFNDDFIEIIKKSAKTKELSLESKKQEI